MPIRLAMAHRYACLGAIALMLTLPFLLPHHNNPIPTFFQEWAAAILGLTALTWLLRDGEKTPLELPEVALLPVGLLLLAVLQGVFQADALTDRLLMFALYLIWAILLAVLGRRLAQDIGLPRLADVMATAVLVGALLEALTGAVQLAGLARLPWVFPHFGGGLRGNLAQTNNFADYLWLGVVSLVYLRSRNWLGNVSAAGALLIIAPLAVLSASRSVWFYGVALPVLAILWAGRSALPGGAALRRWSLLALAATLLFQGAFSSGLVPLPDSTVTAGGRIADAGSYDPVRFTLWRTAFLIFSDNPWLGAGFGQYTRHFLEHVLDLMPRRLPGLPENAHNMLLNLLAEMGIGAGLLLVVFAARWLLGVWRQPRTEAGWWVLAMVLVLAIHANLEYPLWYAFFLGPAALLAGAASPRNRPLRLGPRAPLAIGAFLVLGSLALVTLYQDYSLLEDTLHGRLARNPAEARSRTAAALQQLAGESLLRPYVDLTAANLMDESAEGLGVKLETCERAQRFSASREIVFKCAYLLALAGQDDAASLALRRAVAAYPDRAELIVAQWRRRGADEPILARLAANFPPIVPPPAR